MWYSHHFLALIITVHQLHVTRIHSSFRCLWLASYVTTPPVAYCSSNYALLIRLYLKYVFVCRSFPLRVSSWHVPWPRIEALHVLTLLSIYWLLIWILIPARGVNKTAPHLYYCHLLLTFNTINNTALWESLRKSGSICFMRELHHVSDSWYLQRFSQTEWFSFLRWSKGCKFRPCRLMRFRC